MARLVHAVFDAECNCLALRRTKCYNIKTTENIKFLLRWVVADPVGNTGFDSIGAIAIEILVEPERAAPESAGDRDSLTSSKRSNIDGRLPLPELTSPQPTARSTVSVAQIAKHSFIKTLDTKNEREKKLKQLKRRRIRSMQKSLKHRRKDVSLVRKLRHLRSAAGDHQSTLTITRSISSVLQVLVLHH